MAKSNLTAERLREIVSYDPSTGTMRSIVPRPKIPAGSIIGHKRPDGYSIAWVQRRRYYVHRLIWFYVTGEWPKQHIDHIDGDPSNNRFENLRDVTRTANQQNQRRAHCSNRNSGLLGSHWHAQRNYWVAHISIDNRTKYLGHFQTAKEAHEAYLSAKRKLHPGGML